MPSRMTPHECDICHEVQLAIHESTEPFICTVCAMWLGYLLDIEHAKTQLRLARGHLRAFLKRCGIIKIESLESDSSNH